jgi:hypothetical protein
MATDLYAQGSASHAMLRQSLRPLVSGASNLLYVKSVDALVLRIGLDYWSLRRRMCLRGEA